MTKPLNSRKGAPPAVEAGNGDSALREMVGYNMKRAFSAVQQDLQATLRPFGLRMLSFSVLMIIVDQPNIRQTQIAEALAIERPNLVIVIDELESRGLIVRSPVPSDRRAHALQATLAGRRLQERAVAAVRAHEQEMMRDLPLQEREALVATLRKVETRLAERASIQPSKRRRS